MRRSTLTATILILLILVVAGLVYANQRGNSKTTASPSPSARPSAAASTSPAASPSSSASPTAAATTTTVELSATGFSPSMVTVKAGDSLIFKNTSTSLVQVDSNPHPQHTDNPELNVGQIEPGKSATVVLTRTGTWKIHNHLDPSVQATVVVQ